MRRFIFTAAASISCASVGIPAVTSAEMLGVLAGEGSGAILRIDESSGAGSPFSVATQSLSGIDFMSNGRLFVTNGSGESNLLECDPVTGAVLSTRPIRAGNNGGGIADIAFQPGTNVLFGVTSNFGSRFGLGAGSAGNLVTIDIATGSVTIIGRDPQLGNELGGIAFAPDGTLYFVRGQNTLGVLYRLDPATAAIVGTTALSSNTGFVGLAVRPRDKLLFASGSPTLNQGDVIFTIDPGSGLVTEVGPAGTQFKVHDLAFRPATSAVPAASFTVLAAAALLLAAAGALLLRTQPRRVCAQEAALKS